jgi:HD-GYP domain-containing protein (c-di-GMP phosphodiesterase class II)
MQIPDFLIGQCPYIFRMTYHILVLGRHTIVDEVEKSYDDTIEALGSTLGLKDVGTEAHSQRVTAYAIPIARKVPVPLPYLTELCWYTIRSQNCRGFLAIPETH